MRVDWSDCPLVQADSRYQSGAAALKADPRMTVDALVESADYGMSPSEISTAYGVPVDTVRSLDVMQGFDPRPRVGGDRRAIA